MKYFILFMASLSVVFPLSAAEKPDLGTIISLSADAVMEIPNNEAVVNFRVEARGKDVGQLRKQVDRISNTISQRMKQEKGVKLTTTGRRVDPIWDSGSYNTRKRTGWHMLQTGNISSTNLDAMPYWLDAIERAGAHLQGLNFRISDTLRRSTQEKLRIRAVKRFRVKASTLAKALDALSFQVVRLQTSASAPVYGNRPERTYNVGMLSSMSKSAPAPTLESGESRISVRVSGEIEVEKRSFPVK